MLCLAVITELPNVFGKYTEYQSPSSTLFDADGDSSSSRAQCIRRYAPFVLNVIGVGLFYSASYWFRVIFVHGIPCAMLLVFTWYVHIIQSYKLAFVIAS